MIRAGTLHSSDRRYPDLDCVLSLLKATERPAGDFMVQVMGMDLVYWTQHKVCAFSF